MKQLSSKQIAVIFIIGLLALIGGFAGQHYLKTSDRGLLPSLAGTDFSLLDHQGQAITNDDLAGKPTAIYFGFTWCPDICPTTLSQMADIKSELIAANSKGADDLQLVFFTVDPERDSVTQMSEYLSLFDADIIGITGQTDEIKQTLQRFGVFAKRIDTADDEYLVDHTASVFLYRSDGQFKGTISPAEPYEMALAKMENLLAR